MVYSESLISPQDIFSWSVGPGPHAGNGGHLPEHLVFLSFPPTQSLKTKCLLFFDSILYSLSPTFFPPSPLADTPLDFSSMTPHKSPQLEPSYLACPMASFLPFQKNLPKTLLYVFQFELRNLPCLWIASSRIQGKLWANTAPLPGSCPPVSPK